MTLDSLVRVRHHGLCGPCSCFLKNPLSVNRSRFLLVVASCLWCLALHAQPCEFSLSGRVLDEHDGQVLAFAEVFIPALGVGSVADEQGRYRIEGLCAGTYRVRVAHLGCEPIERQVVLSRSAVMDFRLEHHAEELRELEVIQRRPDEHVGQAHAQMDERAMEKAAGRTLGEMIAVIPGVTALSSGPTISKPVVHGLTGNRVLVLNQGIRQEDQQWGSEHAPNLDPFSSDRITVVKGAASVQYGSDAIGGVVITEPVELPRQGPMSGEVRGLGMLNGRGVGGNALLQGGVKGLRGLGWRVQGSGRSMGDSRSADYNLSNTGMHESGASASIGYRSHRWSASAYGSWYARELGILRAAHIGNLTDLQNAINTGRPWYIGDFTRSIEAPRQTVEHLLAKAEAGYAVTERGRLVLTYGYQADDRQEYDIRRGGRGSTPALDLQLTTHTGDAVYKHWIGRQVHGKAGFSGVYQENINIPGTGIRPLIPNYRKESAGAFLIEHLAITEKLELEAGARIEKTHLLVAKYTANDVLIRPERDFLNHAVSVGLNWSATESTRIRFNLSSAFRPPHVSELHSEGLHHGSAAIERGDAALASERALKAVMDLESDLLNGRARLLITAHASRINGFIYLRPNGYELTIRGAFPVFDYVATDALLGGLDASFDLRIAGPFTWRLRASTVHGRDLVQEEWLFQMPSDRMENSIVFAPRTAGRWKEFEVSATSSLVFEQRRIPEGLDFTTPPPTYHLLGLSASAARPLGKNELRVGLRGSNLLNAAYRDYLDRFRYYSDARGLDLALWITYRFGGNT